MSKLSEEHRRQLRESSISNKTIDYMAKHGFIRTLDADDANKRDLGLEPGLGFKYPGEKKSDDGGEFWRIRFNHPKRGGQKYSQPQNTGSRVYRPEVPNAPTPDDKLPIVIVEGEKKAISVAERLAPNMEVIGIGGIWNWIDKKGSNKILKAIEDMGLYDRKVYILFDSDTGFKPECRKAEHSLASELKARGAFPRIVVLPVKHKGVDDWFYAWEQDGINWRPELRKMFSAAVGVRPAEDYSRIYSEVYSYDEMLNTEFPIPRFFLGDENFGLVAEGMVTFLHSKTNLGKTYLATQMAVCIALGEAFLGLECKHPETRVLVLQGELPPSLFARGRLRPVADYVGSTPKSISFLNWDFNLASASRFREAFSDEAWAGMESFKNLLEINQPDMVVIDPLQSYNNLQESSNDQQRELVKRLKNIARNRNMAIILVDHDKKALDAEGIDRLRGAANKAELCDTALGLAKGENSDELVLRFDKVRYINTAKPDPWVITRETDARGNSVPWFCRKDWFQ
jgi:hypothetical protein